MAEIRIVDATLREGVQAPGVHFSVGQAIEIAKLLDEIGVDAIECGHALVGGETLQRIEALTKLGLGASLMSHARAREDDVRAAKASGADWIGIFCGVNDVSRATRLGGRSVAEALGLISGATSLAKRLGLKVRFTVEDATRTPRALAFEAFRVAVTAGADRICYADTVGMATPAKFADAVAAIRSAFPDMPVEVHVHDDRGFADANAWSAIEAGATWVSTCVNGLGERCGVADLATTLANLDLAERRPMPNGAKLQRLSALVGRIAGAEPDARRPVVGRHAFTHTARLHALAVQRDAAAYSVFDPDRLGRTTEVAPTQFPQDHVGEEHQTDERPDVARRPRAVSGRGA